MTTRDKLIMAGGLAMALIALGCGALLVKYALEGLPAPVPPSPLGADG